MKKLEKLLTDAYTAVSLVKEFLYNLKEDVVLYEEEGWEDTDYYSNGVLIYIFEEITSTYEEYLVLRFNGEDSSVDCVGLGSCFGEKHTEWIGYLMIDDVLDIAEAIKNKFGSL